MAYNYSIRVTDNTTGESVLADINALDAPGGNAILFNGQPAAFQTDVNGLYTFNNLQPQIYVRVGATGYTSQNVTLVPGQNNIKLEGVGGPTATITSTRTFWNKYKTIILLLLALVAVVMASKYKLI